MLRGLSGSARASGRQQVVTTEAATFGKVLDTEFAEVRRRRAVWAVDGHTDDPPPDGNGHGDYPRSPPANLVGLALSGGGIRSATFALGVLQGMSRLGMLKLFDYVSTVSGGGYTGAWWSAWLSRPHRRPQQIFPPPERVEPERWTAYIHSKQDDGSTMPDGSLSASRNDPIHHLRLFSNYLTPRKGLLSADSWRAATVVLRNLVLTWLVLLPVLLAAVVAGQTYFTFAVDPERNFLRDFPVAEVAPATEAVRAAPPAVAMADIEALARQREIAREQANVAARQERLTAIGERALATVWPLTVLMIWMVLLTLVWVVHGSGGGPFLFLASLGGAVAAFFIGWTLYGAIAETSRGWSLPGGWTYVLVAGAAILMVTCRALPTYLFMPRPGGPQGGPVPEDLLRNRAVRALGAVLVATVVLAAVLLVAGFSHDLVWFLFDPASGGPLPAWVKQTGGWAALLTTIGAVLFTGFMGAPAGGDGESHSRPSLASQCLFAITPVLAVGLLAIFAATVGRTLIQRLGDIRTDLQRMDTALLVAIGLFLSFAVFEAIDGNDRRSGWRKAIAPVAALGTGILFFAFGPDPQGLTLAQVIFWTACAVALLPLRWWGVLRMRPRRATAAAPGEAEESPEESDARRHRLRVAALLLPSIVGGIGWPLRDASLAGTRHFEARGIEWNELAFPGEAGSFSLLLLAVALACGIFATLEQLLAPSERPRSVALLTIAVVALCTRAIIPFLPVEAYAVAYSSAAVTLVVLSLAWVVGLGWMANPNMLSLHVFYKARLVRAYLGASNANRRTQEITESAHGDDLPLQSLANCATGAPYQLINTTLNLVGGRDLTTAQRSADSFLLSQHYCGSPRTGYRPTPEYMDGTLSLGTAVAISGAAASPNMGSRTPSAALSMLLALLNVRLAFWAPTPNRALWRDSRPRLWPFYLLREFLSQTDHLSPYCCLSDGGHFDNSGLHSLVARGCRYIVLCDCGADPLPCFEDLGNAIRRCRIDFGAEIDLRIDPFLRTDGKAARSHFTIGSITYSKAHARALRWPHWAEAKERQGVVIWIKPSLTLTDESADLRQYALQNPVFPQQSTSDQWYDEAQFESYRRLGEHTVEDVFGAAEIPDVPETARVKKFFETLRAPEPRASSRFKVDIASIDGENSLRVVESPAPST